MMKNQHNQKYKNRNRLYFIIGLTTGLVLSIVFYVVAHSVYKQTLYFFNIGNSGFIPSSVDSSSMTTITSKEFSKISQTSSNFSVDSSFVDSTDIASYDFGLDEADFMFDIPEEKEVIASDKIIAKKKIKIQYKKDTHEIDSVRKGYFQYFDVEQWDHRLKIK